MSVPDLVIEYGEQPSPTLPQYRRFKARSASRPGLTHELVAIGEKVSSCSCKGWSYGKRCHHARELTRYLADFTELPPFGDPCVPLLNREGPR